MRIGPLLSLVAIAAVASALWWLETLREREPRDAADPAEARAPEAYFDHFRALAWDAEGAARHDIRGRRMTRFTADGDSEVEAPEIRYRDPHGPPWLVVGDRARVDAAVEHVELRGRVVATRDPEAPHPLFLRTEALAVDLAASRAHAPGAVAVLTTGSRLHAEGATAALDTGVVELHQQVRGRHDPTARPH